MAVLIEGISVVVRASAVMTKYEGGSAAFVREVPNRSFCADGELARVGFMVPDDVKTYVSHLESRGLTYVNDREAVDLVVVDQRTGLCVACSWAAFGSTLWNNNPAWPIVVCCAEPTRVKHTVVPDGWAFEMSLSAQHRFVRSDAIPPSLKFLRREQDLEVYYDEKLGKEIYAARSG